jgi:uncharacterized Zn finger protein
MKKKAVAASLANDAAEAPSSSRSRSGPPSGSSDLESYLKSLDKAQLVELVERACAAHPEFRADIDHGRTLAGGDHAAVVRRIRDEITDASRHVDWRGDWRGEGSIPDYSRVQSGLERLLDDGHADAVVELGKELFRAGQEQLGRVHDHGATSMEIAECMAIVFRALRKSTLADSSKILYAIELSLADEYGLDEGVAAFVDRKWSKATWSAVADALAPRLARDRSTAITELRNRYRLDQVSDRLIHALDAAGRGEEADRICEEEAPRTGSYERLVRRLMGGKRLDEARAWAERGYTALRESAPGSAASLRTLLSDLARRRRQWPLAAAYAADHFFERPSVAALQELLSAAQKAGCEREVRAAALGFLETGRRPARSSEWPLPASGLPATERPRMGAVNRPADHWDVLRDLAIEEDRPADVLLWHDRLAAPGRRGVLRSDDADLEVAHAVAATHPDRAIELYRKAAKRLIEEAQPDAYVEAGELLRRVRDLLRSSQRSNEWEMLLAEIREAHRRKRRLMEVLDGLAGAPIVSRKGARRSRSSTRKKPF